MPCCQCCCGGVTCAEGQQGKCCCGGPSGACCAEGEYCCDGVCQEEECCTADAECQFCTGDEAGMVLVSGIGVGEEIIYKCCPEEKSSGLFPVGDARGGGCCDDCSEASLEDGLGGGPTTPGYCCDGQCQEEECDDPP